MYKVAVITVSDKGYNNLRVDTGGPLICELLKTADYEVIYTSVVPDEQEVIKRELIHTADDLDIALTVTTGGTGFSVRDVTPEATIAVCEKLAPGIPEAMRAESYKITNRAMLTRATAGIRGNTLIVNLPGSPKSIRENLEVILPAIKHGLDILRGNKNECGQE